MTVDDLKTMIGDKLFISKENVTILVKKKDKKNKDAEITKNNQNEEGQDTESKSA